MLGLKLTIFSNTTPTPMRYAKTVLIVWSLLILCGLSPSAQANTNILDNVLDSIITPTIDQITNFAVIDQKTKVTLSWEYPIDPTATYTLTVTNQSNSLVCIKNNTTGKFGEVVSKFFHLFAPCQNEPITINRTGDTLAYDVKGLTGGKIYNFTITAKKSDGSLMSGTMSGGANLNGVPTPTNFSFTRVTQGVALSWDIPTSNKVTGYRLAISDDLTGLPICFVDDPAAHIGIIDTSRTNCAATEIYWVTEASVGKQVYVLSGVTDFTMYDFALYAHDKAQNYSAAASKKTLLVDSGNTTLTLRWQSKQDDFALSLVNPNTGTLYCLKDNPATNTGALTSSVGCSSNAITPVIADQDREVLTYKITGLTNGVAYYMAVTDPAINSAIRTPGPSGPISELSANKNETGDTIEISWAQPSVTGGFGEASGYVVAVSQRDISDPRKTVEVPLCIAPKPGTSEAALTGSSGSTCKPIFAAPARLGDTYFLTYTITNAKKDVDYVINVATYNNVGYSAYKFVLLGSSEGLTAWGKAASDYLVKWGEIRIRKGLYQQALDELWSKLSDNPKTTPKKYPYLGGSGGCTVVNHQATTCNYSYLSKKYKISVPEPGVFTHCAENFRGNTGCATIRYDPIPPILISKQVIAPTDPGVTLTFDDTGLSGVASADFVLTHENGTITKQSWVAIGENTGKTTEIVIPLNKVGKYRITYDVADRAANHSKGAFDILAIPGNPYWESGKTSCDVQNKYSCIEFTTDTKIADNADYHTAKVYLRDVRGNPVTSIAGIIDVSTNFKFNNTNFLDQITRTGDPVHYRAVDSDLVTPLDQYGGTETGLLKEKVDGNGVYTLQIFSFSPTSNGYARIAKDNFNIELDAIETKVASTHVDFTYSETSSSPKMYHRFPFAPALTATPNMLSFDTAKNAYVANNSDGAKVRLGVSKRFGVDFKNQSTTRTTSALELGIVADNSADSIVWSDGVIEKAGTTDANQSFTFDPNDPFSSTWNQVPADIQSITANTTNTLRLRASPTRGEAGSGSKTPLFDAYIGYIVDSKRVRHAGGSIWVKPEDEQTVGSSTCGNNVVEPPEECDNGKDKDGKVVACTAVCTLDTNMQNIQIIGTSHTSTPSQGLDSSQAINQSIGDINAGEVRTAIAKNLAAFTKNPDVKSKACRGQSYTIERDWSNLPCRFGNGNILYFDHANVTINDTTGTLVLPEGAKTIIINGGDLYLKSNIVYPGKGNTFGIIVARDDNKNDNPFDDGGNIYIHPTITNIAGAVYAEGTVASVDENGNAQIADRTKTLKNQLLWEGLLISNNTIGGADRKPAACPDALKTTCLKVSGGDELRLKSLATIFDFNYLRLFKPNLGTRAGRNPPTKTNLDGTSNVLLPEPPDGVKNNHPFIIKYDSRIISRPPPLFTITSGAGTTQSGK